MKIAKRLTNRLLKRFGYNIISLKNDNKIKKNRPKHISLYQGLIDYLVQRSNNFGYSLPFVLQIGANDGISGDPLYERILYHKLPTLAV